MYDNLKTIWYEYEIELELEYNMPTVYNNIDAECSIEFDDNIIFSWESGVLETEDEVDKDDNILSKATIVSVYMGNDRISKLGFEYKPIICKINNLIAKDKDQAVDKAVRIIDCLCKELTFSANKNNANRHKYQPKIGANWSSMNCRKSNTYILQHDTSDKIRFIETEWIDINVKSNMKILVHKADVEKKLMYIQQDRELEFLRNEYYNALGNELITSKYLHLFIIIEYIEKHFSDMLKFEPMLSEIQLDELNKDIKEKVGEDIYNDIDGKNRLLSSIYKNLKVMTKKSRAEKLLEILKHMKIDSYDRLGVKVDITVKMLKSFIELRNKLFHGRAEDLKRYYEAVVDLNYICEKIMEYYENDTIDKASV